MRPNVRSQHAYNLPFHKYQHTGPNAKSVATKSVGILYIFKKIKILIFSLMCHRLGGVRLLNRLGSWKLAPWTLLKGFKHLSRRWLNNSEHLDSSESQLVFLPRSMTNSKSTLCLPEQTGKHWVCIGGLIIIHSHRPEQEGLSGAPTGFRFPLPMRIAL